MHGRPRQAGTETLPALAARPGALARSRQVPQLPWLMLASDLTDVCFNVALTAGDVVRTVLLFYLMPMWVVLLARQGLPAFQLQLQGMAWLVLLSFALAMLVGNLALQYGATRLRRANVLSVPMLSEILVASVSSW